MKVALITGGSRGIGRACVHLFQKNNYQVVFFYKQEQLKALEIASSTGAKAIQCDVSNAQDVFEAVEQVLKQYRKIDVLVNNAGISQTRMLLDMQVEDWQNMLNTNLSSVFYTCKAVLPSMLSRKKGSIVNIASMWGSIGAACESHYSASKAGVIAFTKSIAKELAPSGIRVNAVSPGAIETDMLAEYSKEELKELEYNTPLQRLGRAKDVAELVYFLAEEQASFITGQDYLVDGAYAIR